MDRDWVVRITYSQLLPLLYSTVFGAGALREAGWVTAPWKLLGSWPCWLICWLPCTWWTSPGR